MTREIAFYGMPLICGLPQVLTRGPWNILHFLFQGKGTRRHDLSRLVMEHARPSAQVQEKLEPPSFRMQTAEGQSSKDSLLGLFEKPPGTALFDTPPRTTTTETTAAAATTTSTAAAAAAAAAASPVKLAQRFNISSPDKSRLAMELVSEMATPQKVPLIRELVKGATISVQSLNNQTKKYVHIPQCSSEASAMSQVVKYKFIQEIVDTLGSGAEKVAGSLEKGGHCWKLSNNQSGINVERSWSFTGRKIRIKVIGLDSWQLVVVLEHINLLFGLSCLFVLVFRLGPTTVPSLP